MLRLIMQPDLFGGATEAPTRPAPDLTDDASRPSVSRGPVRHTPDTIRALMLDTLAEARAAAVMPWDARALRGHTAMFPYMAEWLKGGEGDRLLAEFKAEMDRLAAPVDQVAPNWRRIWKLG